MPLGPTLALPVGMEILQPEQQVMAAALQVRAARAELLAGNVANADTPGYLARDLKFDDALKQVVENGDQQQGSSFEIAVARQNVGFDKNDIDINEQAAKSYENSLSYVATLKLYGDSIGRLKSATASS